MDFLEELRFLKEQLSFRETIKNINYEKVVLAGMGSSGHSGQDIPRAVHGEAHLPCR